MMNLTFFKVKFKFNPIREILETRFANSINLRTKRVCIYIYKEGGNICAFIMRRDNRNYD